METKELSVLLDGLLRINEIADPEIRYAAFQLYAIEIDMPVTQAIHMLSLYLEHYQ